ncbi:diguanylate cyclase [Deinococcus enclensis]|uniref:Diguanylate cyclase (GGDEF)-like protein n=1 Tax=Deinococcus enclensis TaxID=1049582 RepID=A0ABT9M819_9DEIO|nr:diguanylate cyclase [Deinococcus enclensis]MDP9762718.1 diguanylate cyclase (GGDEF)-like protein [Deinococcus enclensis]
MSLRRLLYSTQLPFWLLLLLAFVLLGRALNARVDSTRQVDSTRVEIAQVNRVMQQVVDMETGVRGYLLTADASFLEPYDAAVASLPGDLARLRAVDALEKEKGTAQEGQTERLDRITTLITRWQMEVAGPELAAARRGDRGAAVAIVRTRTGKKIIDAVRTELTAYTDAENAFLSRSLRNADARLSELRTALYGLLGLALIAGIVSISAGASVLSRHFEALTGAARRLSGGERGVQVREGGPAETRELAAAFNRMSEELTHATEAARTHALELEDRNRSMRQLGDLSDWMQAARSLDEGGQILARALPELLPGTRGTLLHHNASRNLLVPLVSWGGDVQRPGSPEHCWALRRGETRRPGSMPYAPPCLNGEECASVCVPLFSHGETLGILRMTPAAEGAADLDPAVDRALPGVARQVALALASLRLQDRLLQLSIRDPLTGLYNRRHLEDELALHFVNGVSGTAPVSLIALDVDHFKRLNDTFGHEAGDAALVRLAAALSDLAPAGSTPARPGGEEFALLLPGHDLASATALAETLREHVAEWTLSHAGIALGRVTVSLGVAQVDRLMTGPDALVRAADEALYAAKRAGRNCVVQAGDAPWTLPEALPAH